MSMIGQKSISCYDWVENNITGNWKKGHEWQEQNFPIILPYKVTEYVCFIKFTNIQSTSSSPFIYLKYNLPSPCTRMLTC